MSARRPCRLPPERRRSAAPNAGKSAYNHPSKEAARAARSSANVGGQYYGRGAFAIADQGLLCAIAVGHDLSLHVFFPLLHSGTACPTMRGIKEFKQCDK